MKKSAKKKGVSKLGPYVIVRCRDAGVHAGYLKSQNSQEVILTNARRIWYWTGAASISEIAVYGLNPAKSSGSKICAVIPETKLRRSDVCEINVCCPEGQASIEGAPVWRA